MDRKSDRKVRYPRAVGGLLLIPLLLAGCAIHQTPEYESALVASVCAAQSGDTVSVSYRDQTKLVTVHHVNSRTELYQYCGDTGGACVYLSTQWDALDEYCEKTGGDCRVLRDQRVNHMYLLADNRCPQHASHELGHVFGIPNLDAVARSAYRQVSFVGR
jgi:hypothetical protein